MRRAYRFFLVVTYLALAQPALAACPANSRIKPGTENSPVVICNCNAGFEKAAGACVPVRNRMLMMEEDFRSAQATVARLSRLETALQNKIEQVRGWQRGLRKDEAEFQKMKADATADLAWEFVSHLPFGTMVGRLAAQGALTPQQARDVGIAFNSLIALIATDRGLSAQDDRQREDIFKGAAAARAALTAMAGLQGEPAQMLTMASRALDAGRVAALDSQRQMTREQMLQTALSLVSILQPWAKLPALAENYGARAGAFFAANRALERLGEAQSSHFNAERYLIQKLEKVRSDAADAQLVVDRMNVIPRSAR